LFLDEIGDMPFDLQTRLLRVLSDGQYYRVGGHNPMKSNVRVIAATHQNLEDRVKAGAFREDLFHRLNVIRLRLPALRERAEDVPALTRFFLQKSAKELGVEPKRIADSALALLMRFDFPGNVRQLENICHWLTVMAPAQMIEAKDMPPELASEASAAVVAPSPPPVADFKPSLAAAPAPAPVPMSAPVAFEPMSHAASSASRAGVPDAAPARSGVNSWLIGLEQDARGLLQAGDADVWDTLTHKFEAQLIRTALEITRGRRIEAAQKLGIGRNTITRKIQELGLDD
jgi:two-component system nitrogen regulation response regulator GlnG